jgi:hypothetical protein
VGRHDRDFEALEKENHSRTAEGLIWTVPSLENTSDRSCNQCFAHPKKPRYGSVKEAELALQVLSLGSMKRVLFRFLSVLAMVGAVQVTAGKDLGIQMSGVRTNFVDHWVTNTSEIQMQVNRFITEYHTNWLTRAHTNVVDLFSTNLLTVYLTNRVWEVRTNYVDIITTNRASRTVTNHLVLDRIQTNYVQAYYTNLRTLNLTNWTTVVELKTNWITKPMTNVVEFDMPRAVPGQPASAPRAARASEPLSIQASRSGKPAGNSQPEIELKVSWAQAPSTSVHVQQWRVEREDGSALFFGQEQEFKRALANGIYKVVVKAQRDGKGPLLAALGTLTISAQNIVLEQQPARNNPSI